MKCSKSQATPVSRPKRTRYSWKHLGASVFQTYWKFELLIFRIFKHSLDNLFWFCVWYSCGLRTLNAFPNLAPFLCFYQYVSFSQASQIESNQWVTQSYLLSIAFCVEVMYDRGKELRSTIYVHITICYVIRIEIISGKTTAI